LADLLAEDGLLFTGHSELMLFLEAGYQRVDYPQSFACRKAGPAHVASVPRVARPARTVPPCGSGAAPPETKGLQSIFGRSRIATEAAATIHQARKHQRIAPACANKLLKALQPAPPSVSIEEAGQLADQGQLEAATAICERLLSEGTQDPNVFSLLGIISESEGKLTAAEDLFRKALFLDPHHYQSLLHMSLLCERQGDNNGFHLYRARAGRVLSEQEGDREA
jgi:chemotaxis protein methyltransferase WspC